MNISTAVCLVATPLAIAKSDIWRGLGVEHGAAAVWYIGGVVHVRGVGRSAVPVSQRRAVDARCDAR